MTRIQFNKMMWVLTVLIAFALGISVGYNIGINDSSDEIKQQMNPEHLHEDMFNSHEVSRPGEFITSPNQVSKEDPFVVF